MVTECDDAEGGPIDEGRPAPAVGHSPVRRWLELTVIIAVALVAAAIVRTYVAQPFYIPSESMEPTLHGCLGCTSDRIVVNKLVYRARTVHSGDIVVFTTPTSWTADGTPTGGASNVLTRLAAEIGVPSTQRYLVKRVIATGGQTIRCCDSSGRIEVLPAGATRWVSLDEPYVTDPLPVISATSSGRAFAAVTIPSGRLWVMGDNRNLSADSLYHLRVNDGNVVDSTVAQRTVVGKASVIAWPISRWRLLGPPQTFRGLAAGPPAPAWPIGVILGCLSAGAAIAGVGAHRYRRGRP
jgi:signal peptidase I